MSMKQRQKKLKMQAKLGVMFLVITFFHKTSAASSIASNPVIKTTGGFIRGETLNCGLFCRYYSFKGIPYAEPPLNNLRFRAPIPHSGWKGIFEAYRHSKMCPSSMPFGGINLGEDCLTLNVYTKSLTKKLPVMVWIHGGGFYMGSGDDLLYGPDYFVDDGVMVVTINYRLGVLGFLSTNDNNAPGNYGLKDCVLALKWIQNNIAKFGGDPSRVTIYGESAGSALVHYLVLSPIASGLFVRAISQSGTALNPWAYQSDPERIAHNLAKKLGLDFIDNKDLVDQLRKLNSVELVLSASGGFSSETSSFGIFTFAFAPSKDPLYVNDAEIFLPDTPIKLIQSGAIKRVPYIIGFTSNECMYAIREAILNPQIFNKINANPSILIPNWIIVPLNAGNDIAEKIQEFYFHTSMLNISNRYSYSQYVSDVMFNFGITETARYHASIDQPAPTFIYKFGFDGGLQLLKSVLILKEYPGAMHGEDVYYMFKIAILPPPPLVPESKELQMRRLMVRMWTNFAKHGNPTPLSDPIAKTKWEPINGHQEYLNIGTAITAEKYPFSKRMDFWKQFDIQYNF